MKDQRLKVFRSALDGVIESLQALVRVSRWSDVAEGPPEPLVAVAARLTERLGAAGRLSSSKFVGTPVDTAKVNAMCATMMRLDGAYLTYRKRLEREPTDTKSASATLESDIADVLAVATTAEAR